MPQKKEKHVWHVHHVFDKYSAQIPERGSIYVLCIPCLLWQPKGDNVKEETECERCPVQLAVRWKKMLHHKGSFAISLERGSWCRMEMGWFTDTMVLWIKRNVSNHSRCWLHWTFTFVQIWGKTIRCIYYVKLTTRYLTFEMWEKRDSLTPTSASDSGQFPFHIYDSCWHVTEADTEEHWPALCELS